MEGTELPLEISVKRKFLFLKFLGSAILIGFECWYFFNPKYIHSPVSPFVLLNSLLMFESLRNYKLRKWVFLSILLVLFFALCFVGQDNPYPDKPLAFLKHAYTILFSGWITVVAALLLVNYSLLLTSKKPRLIIETSRLKLNSPLTDVTTEILWTDILNVQQTKGGYSFIEVLLKDPLAFEQNYIKNKNFFKRWIESSSFKTKGDKVFISTNELNMPFEKLLPIIKSNVNASQAV